MNGPIDLVPVLAEPVEVVVDIDHLTVRDDGEFFGGAEPYLLLVFFTVDGRSARIEAELDVSDLSGAGAALGVRTVPAEGADSIVSTRRRGRHGNVDAVNIGPIELALGGPVEVPIDRAVGVFRTELEPIPIRLLLDTGDLLGGVDIVGLPGFVGVHAVLMEQDLTPPQAAIAAHEVVADGIASILEEVLAELDLSDLSADPAAFVERQAEIEDAARQAAAGSMNWWELLWGGVVDPDDQLIQAFAIANVLQLGSPVPIQARHQSSRGDWILVGEMR